MRCFPTSYESKVGFDDIRDIINTYTSGSLGRESLVKLNPTDNYPILQTRFARIGEMVRILEEGGEHPPLTIADRRQTILSLRAAGTYPEEESLVEISKTLHAGAAWYKFVGSPAEGEGMRAAYPALVELLPASIAMPKLALAIDALLDNYGHIKDSASVELAALREKKHGLERQVARQMRSIFSKAVANGWVDPDSQPVLRNGRMVLPLIPGCKRQVPGIVHDESSTGKTLFVEPLEIVDLYNEIREIEAKERREIIRLLTLLADELRPFIDDIVELHRRLGFIDGLMAIARFARAEHASIPHLSPKPRLEWKAACHPLLRRMLEREGRELIPLDIELRPDKGRILVISGPNAGGKSVCLKTCGLLQYMLQCGIPIPVHPDSEAGIFSVLAVNIGDDQSLEDDLSTYSSHLTAMKGFAALASPRTLLLVDEFGAGTEPELGGAIAEALLQEFAEVGSFGVVTTHYRNLKQLASHHPKMINGAMLYDRQLMQPLFRLEIGQPGSSFAIEIARKTGLPQQVIARAEELVGSEVIESEKYLLDIARDKQYWQRKRENIRKQEKQLEEQIERLQIEIKRLKGERQNILADAKAEASRLLKESNRQIERTIREIKENAARREETLAARSRLVQFQDTLSLTEGPEVQENPAVTQKAARELEKVLRRQKCKVAQVLKRDTEITLSPKPDQTQVLEVGMLVQSEDGSFSATILELMRGKALLALPNGMTTQLPIAKLKPAKILKKQLDHFPGLSPLGERLHGKQLEFRHEVDLRGMRTIDAIEQTEYFIDEAVQVGAAKVRILHGTGTGALREAVRERLASLPYVRRFYDEDVRLGGAGITIVEL